MLKGGDDRIPQLTSTREQAESLQAPQGPSTTKRFAVSAAR